MRVGDYLDLTIKFHDYSSFFTVFDVASCMELAFDSSVAWNWL